MTTKERILYTALNLFSQKGYKGVSMRDIASTVGIKGSSIYNHYENKQDILNSIVNEMSNRYEQNVANEQLPQGKIEEITAEYMSVSADELVNMVCKIFRYFLNDEYASKFRKLLTMEQYGDNKMSEIYHDIYFENAINFQAELFENMKKHGFFIEADTYVMALQFYSPIYLLICKYDAYPEKEDEAMEILKKHVRQFIGRYEK